MFRHMSVAHQKWMKGYWAIAQNCCHAVASNSIVSLLPRLHVLLSSDAITFLFAIIAKSQNWFINLSWAIHQSNIRSYTRSIFSILRFGYLLWSFIRSVHCVYNYRHYQRQQQYLHVYAQSYGACWVYPLSLYRLALLMVVKFAYQCYLV